MAKAELLSMREGKWQDGFHQQGNSLTGLLSLS